MDTVDRSYEPMDIDLSNSSLKDITCSIKSDNQEKLDDENINSLIERDPMCERIESVSNNITAETKIGPKKLYVNLISKKTKRSTYLLPFAILIACLSVVLYFNFRVECAKMNFIERQEMVLGKLFGQNIPITNLMKALNDDPIFKLIFVYGGTGVGKTYAIDLLLKDQWSYSNIYHYILPTFSENFSTSVLTGLILCPSSVFVIDGLNVNNLNIHRQIKEIIDKSKKLQKPLTIVLIINCDVTSYDLKKKCDKSFQFRLQEEFKDINVTKYYVKFNQLTNNDLLKCIEYELKQSMHIDFNINDFMKNFDVSLDGCKGVHMKVRALIEL